MHAWNHSQGEILHSSYMAGLLFFKHHSRHQAHHFPSCHPSDVRNSASGPACALHVPVGLSYHGLGLARHWHPEIALLRKARKGSRCEGRSSKRVEIQGTLMVRCPWTPQNPCQGATWCHSGHHPLKEPRVKPRRSYVRSSPDAEAGAETVSSCWQAAGTPDQGIRSGMGAIRRGGGSQMTDKGLRGVLRKDCERAAPQATVRVA